VNNGERAVATSYAAVTVSIPPDSSRKIGEVHWPSATPGDPRRDFVTVSADYIDKKDFKASIAKFTKQSGRKKALVFVHGFNNRFDDARPISQRNWDPTFSTSDFYGSDNLIIPLIQSMQRLLPSVSLQPKYLEHIC
jgi:hypothetical protein